MNLDTYFAPHTDSLKLRARRTTLLASNIANADTPNYKARDLAFGETLKQARGGLPRIPLAKSSSAHLRASEFGATARVLYRQPEGASLDGNTVDKDLEQARFAENAMRYEASLQFTKRRTSSLVRALKGE